MLTTDVHDLLLKLPLRNYQTPSSELPLNGIYIFFERGEQCSTGDTLVPRIVRVGTHRVDGRFPGRIRNHFGSARTLGGNKNSSVFRRHLGGALLRRDNPADERLMEWTKQGGDTFREVEADVSRYLRDQMTYVCFRVDRASDRLSLESGLIALLAQHPLARPSSSWIGMHATSSDIRETGLWNTNHVRDTPLTNQQFRHLEELVTATIDGCDAGTSLPQSDDLATRAVGPVGGFSSEVASPPSTDDGIVRKTLVIVPCGAAKI